MLVDSLPAWDLLSCDLAAQSSRLQAGPSRRRSSSLSRGSGELTRRGSRQNQSHVLRACKTARRCQPEPEEPVSPRTDRQRHLLRYAQEVTPEIIGDFEAQSPAYVGEAMRDTISKLLGDLPDEFFCVKISATHPQALAQLCYSILMTGYLFAQAQKRLEFQAQFSNPDDLAEREAVAFEFLAACKSESGYAEGSQKHQVAGHVLRWHQESGLQAIPAEDYIASLERQVAALRRQVAKDLYLSCRSNPLLSFLRGLEAPHLKELTTTGADTQQAIEAMVHTVMQASGAEQSTQQPLFRAGELASLLYWLCIVGYHLRTLEDGWDMEQTMLCSATMVGSTARG